MTIVSFVLFLGLVRQGNAQQQQQQQNHDPSENVPGLLEWIQSLPNGFVSNKITIPQDTTTTTSSSVHSLSASNVFLFAQTDITKNETVMYIPTQALIGQEKEVAGRNCPMLRMILEEYDKGTESKYYPYIRFLLGRQNVDGDDGIRKATTAAWSTKGQALLKTMVGRELLPYKFLRLCTSKCPTVCSDNKDPKRQQLQQDAYLIVMSRKKSGLMIPLFDFINHRNGKWQNVDMEIHTDGVRVYAIRDILAGEQLYRSLTECINCGNYKYKYVTQHVLQDCGFVEAYPRRWVVDRGNTKESLVAEITVDKDDNGEERVLRWPRDNRRPTMEELDWIQTQLSLLRQLNSTMESGLVDLKSQHERSVIEEYYLGYMEAMELVMMDSEHGHKQSHEMSIEDAATDPNDPDTDSLDTNNVCQETSVK
ncbi:SET methyltransferase domain containing protein [Nitzschia inconspicua]|uniref:SET methyltransferase domain containing protein n=1 Tax=Nitzschia inconspicua TaxID=303405 RepID=A0A9K3LKC7_9STRA|nr:SET methyltransferase domain containing protein [Nitzschia inconspicua]